MLRWPLVDDVVGAPSLPPHRYQRPQTRYVHAEKLSRETLCGPPWFQASRRSSQVPLFSSGLASSRQEEESRPTTNDHLEQPCPRISFSFLARTSQNRACQSLVDITVPRNGLLKFAIGPHIV